MNNYIISCYLTSAPDTQRGITTKPNNPEYIQKWYDSVVRLELNGIVLHDNLSDEFMEQFSGVEFVSVPDCPKKMQLYDYRWILYRQFMLNRDVDSVFFTDISDVEVMNDPFPHVLSGMLYCGDERQPLQSCAWLNPARENPVLRMLDEFNDILSLVKPVLNCGILGGNADVVIDFLETFAAIIFDCSERPIEHTVDMGIFNYAMYYYNFDVTHGHPVNSVFRGGLNEMDVWFRHK